MSGILTPLHVFDLPCITYGACMACTSRIMQHVEDPQVQHVKRLIMNSLKTANSCKLGGRHYTEFTDIFVEYTLEDYSRLMDFLFRFYAMCSCLIVFCITGFVSCLRVNTALFLFNRDSCECFRLNTRNHLPHLTVRFTFDTHKVYRQNRVEPNRVFSQLIICR